EAEARGKWSCVFIFAGPPTHIGGDGFANPWQRPQLQFEMMMRSPTDHASRERGVAPVCEWCEPPFRARRGGSPQRFCVPSIRQAFWSGLRRFGEQALESGILTIADLRTGSARACTLLQHTETAPPLLEAAPSDFVPPGASMRFSVEVERTTVGW